MKLKANAKINLTLDVIGKRDDGYHLIDSVFQSVSLCDEISVEKCDAIVVRCTDSTISDKSNIAYKAAEKFFEYVGLNGGAEIVIQKHIPLASGMGGGSADAAAVIVALDKLYGTKLTKTQLCEIGLSVGADVPFCIVGGTARVGGIGEKMTKLPDMPDCAVLLIKHGKKLSTADMYKKIDSCPQTECYTQTAVEAIEKGDLNRLCQNVSNAFSAVFDNTELINDIKATNPQAVSLSGSGPTVFAIYNNIADADKAKNTLQQADYKPIIATPSKNGIIFE
ncbi:MAG: 4-(cytidine 5'-diphospho)-2-C-methyl-D-erythritol kinase [Clostridia bacterium]|nr:4-(cytidine 5'-diphospho)-2-C-methyl-D-erythritol kinase [Clostridia bacterium]